MSIEEKQNFPTYQDSDIVEYLPEELYIKVKAGTSIKKNRRRIKKK